MRTQQLAGGSSNVYGPDDEGLGVGLLEYHRLPPWRYVFTTGEKVMLAFCTVMGWAVWAGATFSIDCLPKPAKVAIGVGGPLISLVMHIRLINKRNNLFA